MTTVNLSDGFDHDFDAHAAALAEALELRDEAPESHREAYDSIASHHLGRMAVLAQDNEELGRRAAGILETARAEADSLSFLETQVAAGILPAEALPTPTIPAEWVTNAQTFFSLLGLPMPEVRVIANQEGELAETSHEIDDQADTAAPSPAPSDSDVPGPVTTASEVIDTTTTTPANTGDGVTDEERTGNATPAPAEPASANADQREAGDELVPSTERNLAELGEKYFGLQWVIEKDGEYFVIEVEKDTVQVPGGKEVRHTPTNEVGSSKKTEMLLLVLEHGGEDLTKADLAALGYQNDVDPDSSAFSQRFNSARKWLEEVLTVKTAQGTVVRLLERVNREVFRLGDGVVEEYDPTDFEEDQAWTVANHHRYFGASDVTDSGNPDDDTASDTTPTPDTSGEQNDPLVAMGFNLKDVSSTEERYLRAMLGLGAEFSVDDLYAAFHGHALGHGDNLQIEMQVIRGLAERYPHIINFETDEDTFVTTVVMANNPLATSSPETDEPANLEPELIEDERIDFLRQYALAIGDDLPRPRRRPPMTTIRNTDIVEPNLAILGLELDDARDVILDGHEAKAAVYLALLDEPLTLNELTRLVGIELKTPEATKFQDRITHGSLKKSKIVEKTPGSETTDGRAVYTISEANRDMILYCAEWPNIRPMLGVELTPGKVEPQLIDNNAVLIDYYGRRIEFDEEEWGMVGMLMAGGKVTVKLAQKQLVDRFLQTPEHEAFRRKFNRLMRILRTNGIARQGDNHTYQASHLPDVG